MPPTASLWTGVIAAVGALIGVLVAQWWTTHREDRNWQRQLQMYTQQWEDQRERDREQREDQRQRDAEQREDQRRRDQELWKREDRYRFAADKRSVYAEFAEAFIEVAGLLTLIVHDLQLEIYRRQHDGEDPLIDTRRWARDKTYITRLEAHAKPFHKSFSLLRLLAPSEVDTAAREIVVALDDAERALLNEQDLDRAVELIDSVAEKSRELRELMRADLGGFADPTS